MGAMLPAMVIGGKKLTQIIVHNRVNNGEKLDDEDIYKTSLKRCMPDAFEDNLY